MADNEVDNDFDFNLEKAKKDQEDAQNKKSMFGALGAIGAGFDRVPTAASLLYNQKVPQSNIGGSFDQMAKDVVDPTERQIKLYQDYKTAKDAQNADLNFRAEKDKADFHSELSKNNRSLVDYYIPGIRQKMGDESFNKLSARDLEGIVDMQGLRDKVDIANDKNQTSMSNVKTKADAFKEYGKQKYGIQADKIALQKDRNEANAFNGIMNDKSVVDDFSGVKQAKKDLDLIADAKEKGLTGLKAKELVQSYVSLLKGRSAGSVGAEREELEHAARDGEQWLATIAQKFQPQGMYKYQDMPFLNEIESSVRSLHKTMSSNLKARAESKRRGSSIESINKVQDDAINQLMKSAEVESPQSSSPIQHPEVDSAAAWAKQNPDDPRAKEIMKRIGL